MENETARTTRRNADRRGAAWERGSSPARKAEDHVAAARACTPASTRSRRPASTREQIGGVFTCRAPMGYTALQWNMRIVQELKIVPNLTTEVTAHGAGVLGTLAFAATGGGIGRDRLRDLLQRLHRAAVDRHDQGERLHRGRPAIRGAVRADDARRCTRSGRNGTCTSSTSSPRTSRSSRWRTAIGRCITRTRRCAARDRSPSPTCWLRR